MRITSLRVSHFRNLIPQLVPFHGQIILICGENGQGKTSLLEAIYTTAHARSFRTNTLREVIAWDGAEAQVHIRADTQDGEKELQCTIAPTTREILVNGNKIERASAYYGQLTCIAFTPESLQLVQAGPSVRRRFIDRSISMLDPSYVDTLVQYQRALKSRNALLSKFKRESSGSTLPSALVAQLEVWEDLLSSYGCHIIQRRAECIEKLAPRTQQYYNKLSNNKESVELRYQPNIASSELEQQQARALFLEILQQRRAQDYQRGSTSCGPHRDELALLLSYGPHTQLARESASQGQSRTFALAMNLAVMQLVKEVRAEPPIVLLDDVESELDIRRRTALFEVLDDFQAQVILSATEPSVALTATKVEASILRLDAGRIEVE